MRPGAADDRDTRGRLLDAWSLITLAASVEGQAAPIAVIAFLSSIGCGGQIGLSDRRTKIAGETEGKEGIGELIAVMTEVPKISKAPEVVVRKDIIAVAVGAEPARR